MLNSDKYLINSLKSGNKDAYKYIYDNHYSSLCIYANRYVHNSAVSEDVVSNVIAKIYENHKTITIKTSLISYLFRAVRNQALNYLRDNKKEIEGRVSIDIVPGTYEFAIKEQCTDSIIAKELDHEIKSAIDKLPPKCKLVFLKSRYDQKSYMEIATELNISVNSVENHISKALKQLRVFLKDHLLIIIFLIILKHSC